MLEQCGTLRESWYAAMRSQQLKSNSPQGCVILEQPMVVWRGLDGKPSALEDRCAHRNAPLSKGAVFKGTIGCPYHGWVYDARGACIEVPSQGLGGKPPHCRVNSFPVLERNGLIWIWMGVGEPVGDPFPMPFYESEAEGWKKYYMETHFANEVTHLVENFMDVPHTRFVHFGWFRKHAGKEVKVEIERTLSSVLVTYHLEDDEIGFTSRILNPKREALTHTDKFYMPNTTRVDYGFGSKRGFVITSTCTPLGPFETLVFTLISYRLGWLNFLAPIWLPFYTRKVIQQDVDIMRIQGDNLKRFGGEMEFNSTEADLLHEYIESLREFAATQKPGEKGGTPPEPRIESLSFWI